MTSQKQQQLEKFISSQHSTLEGKTQTWKRDQIWRSRSIAIALQVLDALDQKGWTQQKLAEELGVSPQRVSKIVKGAENFTLQAIASLEIALGISIDTSKHIEPERTKRFKQVAEPGSDLTDA